MADAPERTPDIYTPDEIEQFADKMHSVGANPFKSLWKGGKALATIMHLQERVTALEQERDRLYEAGNWLAHLAHGLGKAGRIAEGEWEAAWKAMQDALALREGGEHE